MLIQYFPMNMSQGIIVFINCVPFPTMPLQYHAKSKIKKKEHGTTVLNMPLGWKLFNYRNIMIISKGQISNSKSIVAQGICVLVLIHTCSVHLSSSWSWYYLSISKLSQIYSHVNQYSRATIILWKFQMQHREHYLVKYKSNIVITLYKTLC